MNYNCIFQAHALFLGLAHTFTLQNLPNKVRQTTDRRACGLPSKITGLVPHFHSA